MDWKASSEALEGEPSTMGRAGVMVRPPIWAVRLVDGWRLMIVVYYIVCVIILYDVCV